jgi:hypothetical protein
MRGLVVLMVVAAAVVVAVIVNEPLLCDADTGSTDPLKMTVIAAIASTRPLSVPCRALIDANSHLV